MTRTADRSPGPSPAPSVHGAARPRHVLDPVDRLSEVLFGLIMALTFTGSLSVAEAGRQEVRTMLIGALGCNLAWGVIDGVMYLLARLTERGRGIRLLASLRAAPDVGAAHRALTDELPPVLAATLRTEELEALRQGLLRVPAEEARTRLDAADWRAALGVFALVVLTTLPVAVPFLFVQDAKPALRLSNAIAIGMLFLVGAGYGKRAGIKPWHMGLSMVGLGFALVGLTVALGG